MVELLSDITGFCANNHLVLFQNLNGLVPTEHSLTHCNKCLPGALTGTSQIQQRPTNTTATPSTLVHGSNS